MTVPLTGYLDRISARAGEQIEVKVSSQLSAPYAADLVRVVSGDPNPDGPGMRLVPVEAEWAGSYPSRPQAVRLGSSVLIPATQLKIGDNWTINLRLQPWLLDDRPRVLMSRLDASGNGWSLAITAAGPVFEEFRDGGARRAELLAPPQLRCWYQLSVSVTADAVRLTQRPLQNVWGAEGHAGTVLVKAAAPSGSVCADIVIGAKPDGLGVTGVFDGRIEDPQLHSGADAPASDTNAVPSLLAWWDFSLGIDGQTITDVGPLGLHGVARNMPMRAVRGSRWSGDETSWRHAPRDYAAIHFHADDLDDCRWETDFTITIPDTLRSGAYGVRLRGSGNEDVIPFYVLAPRGSATAPVAFLAASFTYQAYANHMRTNCDADYRARREAWGAYAHNPEEHPEYGFSTYNRHPDNSGIAYSTRLRPILTWRPGFLTLTDARGSGLRHYPADTHLFSWMEHEGIEYDVITDEDLDNEGVALLSPYRAIVTSSHPEYHTPGTLNALQSYLGQGGRLCYMGGNGFYWRIARKPDLPHVIEIRRAEGGIRAWAAEPGEYHNALDGALGGLWRRNGRAPQALVGVGFSAQGQFEGSYYRRLPASHASENAWIFEGVEDDIIGNFGLSGGGAAGFELDRVDHFLGSPPNIRILARSEAHQSHFVAVPEELLTHVKTVPGERAAELVRAEIVYFDTVRGGAVFSTGSITFSGSLPYNNFDNSISRLLRNVVKRFVEVPTGETV